MIVQDAGDTVLSDVAVADHTLLRRLVLLGTPLALAILEFFHPERPSGAREAVEQGVWFMWFHIIQVPLIGLIALAVYRTRRVMMKGVARDYGLRPFLQV